MRSMSGTTNWKVLAENFMESYHLFQLHGPTIGKQSKVEEMDMPPGGGHVQLSLDHQGFEVCAGHSTSRLHVS